MARLILQTVLLVTLISALNCAPQNPTTARNVAGPAIATLEAKPNGEHSSPVVASSDEAKIRPARTPHHDGTDHDHAIEHPAENTKLNEHIDHGSSTTPKTRPARAAEKEEKHEDSHGQTHSVALTKDTHEHKHDATTGKEQARPARATEEEKKGAVHDQPIPIPTTLKEAHHETTHTEEKKETTHTEENKETPKHKRETHDEKDKSEESPLTYTKTNSEQNEGDNYFALPNKESEYNRHVRQANDEHHSLEDKETVPEHSHLLTATQHHHDDIKLSSSEENKSKSS